MTKEYLNQLNGVLDNDINTLAGGINTYLDKAFIDADQLAYAMNVTCYKPPMLCTRASRKSTLHEPMEAHVVSMWAYNDDLVFFITMPDDPLESPHLNVNAYYDGNWHWHIFAAQDLIWSSNYYFCYARNGVDEYLYITTLNAKYRVKLHPSNALGPADAPVPIEDDHYGFPAFHKGRLFFADPSTNIVTYSALYDFDNFTPVPDTPDPAIDYSSYAGDFLVTNSAGDITMIKSFDDKLVIFAEHSMHLLYGDTPLINSASQFQLVDMNNNLGCIKGTTVAIGGGNLFWLGDDCEVYMYTGSSVSMISRPIESRYWSSRGGISNIRIKPYQDFTASGEFNRDAMATATSSKYFLVCPIEYKGDIDVKYSVPLMVYDIYAKTWWAEDGAFTAIANLSFGDDNIVMARDLDIFLSTKEYSGTDEVWGELGKEDKSIEYSFHTRVYGADGVNSRKSISKVWFQASADADVYLTDSWTNTDYWTDALLDNTKRKIGTLEQRGRELENRDVPYHSVYEPNMYEQQVCYVEKMYGQRLNAFQIIVEGTGASKFFLMKREWSAR